jgi:hydroxyacylglutathione hydrolase
VVRENLEPTLVFTGDLLFVGDVGRPDLRDADSNPRQLAEKLYDSLFGKILSLPENVRVYPAHGAGSLCGRALGSAPFTTIGQERQFNWAAQIKDRGEFVTQMLSNLPDRPAYFSFDVGVNLRGAPPVTDLPPLRSLTETETKQAVIGGAVVIDTRSAPFFGAAHLPGSLNIGLGSAMFSTWTGFFVRGDSPVVLVVGEEASAAKARLELARIGFDQVIGFLLADSLKETRQLPQFSVCELKSLLKCGRVPSLLDVRTAGEWQNEHIDIAQHLPLPALPKRLSEVPRDQPVTIICGSGYRSSLAASLLLREGYKDIANVMGGMNEYQESKCADWQAADLVFVGENI